MNKLAVRRAVSDLIKALGVDPASPNFVETPVRVMRMYGDLGLDQAELEFHVSRILQTTFPSDYRGMVCIDNIDAAGMCPHHLLPVVYKVHVGYIPNESVIGLSKIPRLVQLLANRLVLQEQLTVDIVNYLDAGLKPQGVIAVVKGSHQCMSVRGVKAINSTTTTSSVSGVFSDDASAKSEFLDLIGNAR